MQILTSCKACHQRCLSILGSRQQLYWNQRFHLLHTRFAAAELGRSSTLATGAGAPMAWVCSPHTGPQIRSPTDDPHASAASASSALWSISSPRPVDFRVSVWRFLKKTEIPRRFLKKTAIPIIKMGNSADLEIDLPLLRRRGHFYIEG